MPKKGWLENQLFQNIAWAIVCCYIIVQILASFGTPLARYDEAVPLVAADLILHGHKAAIDFWSFYPPLYYYLILAGFHSLGRSALVPTCFGTAIYLVFLIAVGRFCWKSFPHLRALTPLIIFPTVIAIGLVTHPVWPGYAVSFLALLAYINSRNGFLHDERWIAIAGVLAGLSTLIRFNFGPYVLFVACADILVHELFSGTSVPAAVPNKRSLAQIAIFVVPFVLTNVIFYVWIYRMEALVAPVRMIKFSMRVMGRQAFMPLRPNLTTLTGLGFPYAWMGLRNVLYVGKLRSFALIAAVGAVLIKCGPAGWTDALGLSLVSGVKLFFHNHATPVCISAYRSSIMCPTFLCWSSALLSHQGRSRPLIRVLSDRCV